MDSVAKPFWSLHTHSKFSVNDALPEVGAIVERADELGYPAIGLTDHGNPSGVIQLYKAARKKGIEPLPGIEIYVSPDTEAKTRETYHMCLAAYSEDGYRNLMRLATLSNQQYYYKPVLDLPNFAQLAEDGGLKGIVATTGCLGGLVTQTLIKRGVEPAVRLTKALAGWFPRLYVELQNHGIALPEYGITDDDVLEGLWEVAQRASVPVILARDSHYVMPEERPLHDALKQLVSWSDSPDDAVFNGDGYFMATAEDLKSYYPRRMLEAGLDGLTDLANAAYVRLPELETFTMKIPDVVIGLDPQEELERITLERMPREWRDDPVYMKWLRDEFDSVRSTGQAPYLLLVDDVCTFMRAKGIRYWARGSASGSLILRINQVTQADPVAKGLRFDRFISSQRTKPADVDLDVMHERRKEVEIYVRSKWSVVPVGSLMKYSLFDDDEGEGDHSKGSLRTRFYSTLTKKGMAHPEWRDIPRKDKDMLYALSDRKLISGYGRHAAGLILAPNDQVLDDLPLAWIASSRQMVTAYGKKDVEALGYVKLDLLGQRTATQVSLMEEATGIAFEHIPEDDDAVFKMIARGDTAGVFQLKGWSMQKGCKRLRPTSTADISAAQALFRPAVQRSGMEDAYLDRRARREPVPVRHEDIIKATRDTYGVLLYQEQVMDVMDSLGLTQAQREEMLDAVKASNEYSAGAARVIEDMLPVIRELATARGWAAVDIDWLAEALAAYSDYSFNKAHAEAYGWIAYRCAWMKLHYPLQFWWALLVAYDDHDLVKVYTTEARREGIRVMPPHVNRSQVSYTLELERNVIRRGLLSVKGVGIVGARELASKAPFTSLTDLGERVLPRRVTGARNLALGKKPFEAGGMIAALDDIGALEGLEK